MSETRADILLHPVRIKIVQSLVNKRLTVQKISEMHPEIPQASLYRHLKKLVDAKIIDIVEQNQVRGAIEKIYALPENTSNLDEETILNASKEEHLSYFLKFMAIVLSDFEDYLDQENVNLKKDRVGYRQVAFYANEEEFNNFLGTLGSELMKLIQNEPSESRKKYTLSTILTSRY